MEYTITKIEAYNYEKISANDGYYLTLWAEGDDIKTFSGTRDIYINDSKRIIENLRTITDEEYNELEELKNKVFEEENEKLKEGFVDEPTSGI